MYQGNLAPISNRADWFGSIELVNDETGEVITDLSGISMRLEVRARDECRSILSASTEDGKITFASGGLIQWHFTSGSMRNVAAGTYEIGITAARDGVTSQQLIATLPIIDGVVRP